MKLIVVIFILFLCPEVFAQNIQSINKAEIKQLIITEANNIGLSSSLALALAHTESYFNPRAESHKGARGLMQIMPATATGEYAIHPDSLWDPRINIRLGLHYLKRLLTRYHGRVDLALSHYNGGSRVGKWPFSKVIPATKSYVNKVKRLQYQYSNSFSLKHKQVKPKLVNNGSTKLFPSRGKSNSYQSLYASK